jgi:hypothetical protein
MKTGFTVDTQRGDIEPDFVEGGGSRWTPVEETVARIFACSLIRTAIGSYQPKPSNNMKKKGKKKKIWSSAAVLTLKTSHIIIKVKTMMDEISNNYLCSFFLLIMWERSVRFIVNFGVIILMSRRERQVF